MNAPVANPIISRDFRGLWSLWELMREFQGEFFKTYQMLNVMHQVLTLNQNQQIDFPADDLDPQIDAFDSLRQHLIDLGLMSASLALHRAIEILRKAPRVKRGAETFAIVSTGDSHKLRNYTTQASDRIADDFRHQKVLVLTPTEGHGYENSEHCLGDGVLDKFPSIRFEADEAGKCLALGRPTAAVFHLMRAMEVGIQAARKCMGIPDPIKAAERNWGVIQRKFKEEMERRDKQSQWSGNDKSLFADIYVSLDAVKNVWRNGTMHVENKYLPKEADHILVAVSAFMKKLSSRMDEDGKPLV